MLCGFGNRTLSTYGSLLLFRRITFVFLDVGRITLVFLYFVRITLVFLYFGRIKRWQVVSVAPEAAGGHMIPSSAHKMIRITKWRIKTESDKKFHKEMAFRYFSSGKVTQNQGRVK